MNNDTIRFLSASGPLIGPGFASPTVAPGTAGMPDQQMLQALAAAHAPFAPLPPHLYPGFARDLKPEMLHSHGPPGAIFFDPTAMAMAAAHPFHPYAAGLDGARRKNATRETTAPLKQWLNDHKRNPYPTKAEKIMLALLTKMTMTQVATWFANARRRLKKENKMTWSPRNRPGEDDDDDIDIDRPLSSISVESNRTAPDAPAKDVQESPTTTASPEDTSAEEPKPKKAKIWSIAETLNSSDEHSSSKSSASDLHVPCSSACSPDLKSSSAEPPTVVSPISFVSSSVANPFAQQYMAMISRMSSAPFAPPPMFAPGLVRPPPFPPGISAPPTGTLRHPSASPAASVKSDC